MAKETITKGRTAGLYIGMSTLFKVFLLAGVALISAVFIWYTFNVIEKLKEDTRAQVERYVRMWQLVANLPNPGRELQIVFDEIIVKASFPIIVVDADYKPVLWRNVDEIDPTDTTRVAYDKITRLAAQMREENGEFPLYIDTNYVNYFCYGDSIVISQLKMMPFIEIGIIVAFMIVGMIGFQNIRRSEERHIWVGMAKETAHQLGTPISSLMGWVEVMEAEEINQCLTGEKKEFMDDTVENMKTDINRLQKVAKRFGQIGSIPELKPCDLNATITEAVEYYRRRLPFEGKGIHIYFEPSNIPPINLNAELFGWVLENMIKNSLQSVDAKEGVVKIATYCSAPDKEVTIELIDNGRGIPSGAQRKIFRAGFTTKKRGWGLGLTLVKRIVEDYHKGRVYLKKSKPGETVFEMTLPLAKNIVRDKNEQSGN